MSLPRLFPVLLLIVLGFPACRPSKPASKKDAGADLEDPVLETGVGRNISAADLEALRDFAKAYASACSAGNDEAAQAAWNTRALFDLAVGDAGEIEPEISNQAKRTFVSSLEKKPGGLMSATFKHPWRMLRIHEVDGETRVLCRTVADGAVNYMDLIPRINANGEPEFVDAYAFGSGEKLSATFRRVLLPQIAEAAKSPVDRLTNSTEPLLQHHKSFAAFSESIQAENFGAAIEEFETLPAELRENKTVLLLYLTAASRLLTASGSAEAEAAYETGVTRFQDLFGDDPAFLLMGIDYEFFREDYGALDAIDRLDEAVSGDPYLDFFRASVLMFQQRFDEALPLAEKAQRGDPEIEDPYWGIVNIQLARGDFEAVAKGLDQLATLFDYEIELDDDPAYLAFRNSPEGKAWIERHRKVNQVN